jgi:hypothetical protein
MTQSLGKIKNSFALFYIPLPGQGINQVTGNVFSFGSDPGRRWAKGIILDINNGHR